MHLEGKLATFVWTYGTLAPANPAVGVELSSCDTAASCGLSDIWLVKHPSVQDACESKHALSPPLSVFLVELIAHGASLRRIPSLPGTARPFWREMPAAVNCTQVVRGLGEACAQLCLFACDSIHLCHSVHYKVVAHWSVFKCKTSA